jgi:protein gp37
MSSKIEWTTETWNPIIGCTKVSPGCDHCYAEKMATRLASMNVSLYKEVIKNGHWNGKIWHNISMFEKPFAWKKPRTVFVCSMSDIFHEKVEFVTIDHIIDVIRWTPKHTYIILTKRPERMNEYFSTHVPEKYLTDNGNILDNLWLGVTAENQEQADKRIPILLNIPAAKRFVSIEPMLGPVSLTLDIDPLKWGGMTRRNVLSGAISNPLIGRIGTTPVNSLDWVICGSESGPGRRPFEEDWARSLRDFCRLAEVPFFYKQRYIGNKKFSMPLLDGRVWDQIPTR